jgi:hypothetical protein
MSEATNDPAQPADDASQGAGAEEERKIEANKKRESRTRAVKNLAKRLVNRRRSQADRPKSSDS